MVEIHIQATAADRKELESVLREVLDRVQMGRSMETVHQRDSKAQFRLLETSSDSSSGGLF